MGGHGRRPVSDDKHERIIKASSLAEWMDWPVWKARYWLKRSPAAQKVGRLWVTTASMLKSKDPVMYDAVVNKLSVFDDLAECSECETMRYALAHCHRVIDALAAERGLDANALKRVKSDTERH